VTPAAQPFILRRPAFVSDLRSRKLEFPNRKTAKKKTT
jgi:hypothetical protein